jgi:L-fucose isomerase-like protein
MTHTGTNRTTIGVIVGNRAIFPDAVARDGRAEILGLLEKQGFNTICLTPEDTKFGTVETLSDAIACSELFRRHASQIEGILVTLPNFGDERGVANAIRMSGLTVPVLVQAYPDRLDQLAMTHRRDAFCGKFSVCSNLTQYNIPFTLTAKHTVAPDSPIFREDLRRFGGTCRIVRGLKNSRFGSVGGRPGPFNSVRYSEKLLEHAGISVDVVDMADVLGRIGRLGDGDQQVQAKLQAIQRYTNVKDAPKEALLKMAKFAVVLEDWVQENRFVGLAVQCWSALQEVFGIVPCTVMSMLSNGLLPSACEVDMAGAIAMYALQLASGTPSAIVDWNNNYEDDDNKCVLFHCSNFPKHFYQGDTTMDTHAMLMKISPQENTWGTLQGRVKTGPMTFLRISTDDVTGKLTAYAAEGESVADPAPTWGGIGVVRVPQLQDLLRYVCENNFEHHVSVSLSSVGPSLVEALHKYLGWEVYAHHVPGFPVARLARHS